MNKLTKIGVSALCGSLAGISAASAGDLSVTGAATATWSKLDYGVTGNPLGMASAITFKGSGELDNGSTFTLTIDQDDKSAYSASQIALTVPGLGTFSYDEGGGTGLDRLDDKMPTAWEETDGTAVSAGLQTVAGAGGSTDIEWAIDSGMLPDGMSAYIAYSPRPDGNKAADKTGTAAGSKVSGHGYDIVLEHSGLVDGLNVFAGYSMIEQATSTEISGDRTATAVGATYAAGGFTIGYQHSKDNLEMNETATNYYENDAFGISFNVNDDLSISYGSHKSERNMLGATNVELEAQSVQIAYTMGGASIKLADTDVDNANYTANTDRSGTTVALSLAF